MKLCTKCHTNKPVIMFHKDRITKDGYYPSCKNCVNSKPSKVDKVKKAEYDKNYRKSLGFKKAANQYKVTVEFLELLFINQKGLCAICGRPETDLHPSGIAMRLSIDHCHVTGKVRGFLCNRCNKALGLFKDDTFIVNNALNYLKL